GIDRVKRDRRYRLRHAIGRVIEAHVLEIGDGAEGRIGGEGAIVITDVQVRDAVAATDRRLSLSSGIKGETEAWTKPHECIGKTGRCSVFARENEAVERVIVRTGIQKSRTRHLRRLGGIEAAGQKRCGES